MATVSLVQEKLAKTRRELAKVLVGQTSLVDRLLIGLLVNGHLLLEGVPGLAKTLAVRLLARAVGAQFGRIAFTPDLLPADLVGTEVFQPKTGDFTVRRGPIFVQILLADEINRAPAKVQSALLQAMQERRVTIGGETLSLPAPFLVIATQNPIEHEGTYPLPEAQLDRFFMKVIVEHPSRDEELDIVDRFGVTSTSNDPEAAVEAVLPVDELYELRRDVDAVHVDYRIKEYAVDLARATRSPKEYGLGFGEFVEVGASPRASIALVLAARAFAVLEGRDFVVPHDVKTIAADVLRHRIVRSFEGEAANVTTDELIGEVLSNLDVP